MDQKPLLSIKNLYITFSEFGSNHSSNIRVVNNLSLDIHTGEIVALVGESGSGKSITGLATLGLIPSPGKVISGKIVFDGLDLLKLSKNSIYQYRGNRISMIFQDPTTALNPTLTVGYQISEAYELHNKSNRRKTRMLAIELLGRVGIPDSARIYDSYPHQLSGGLRQRVMIAMALICEPELLIADEPTTSLDTYVQAQILDLLLELQGQFGMSILLISHNIAVVSEFADTVAVMYAGKIMEKLPAKEIAAGCRHPYTQNLIEVVPSFENRGQALPIIKGSLSEIDRHIDGCPFSRRCKLVEKICHNECPPIISYNSKHQYACHLDPTRMSKY